MAFDAHANLAVAVVVTPPAPADTGLSLTVSAGEGARFPAAPFNATVWPATAAPGPANAEIVRVTARTGDTLTITRAQEGTPARAIAAGNLISATITAKAVTDLEAGTNFPIISTSGFVLAGAGRFSLPATFPTGGPAVEVSSQSGLGYVNAFDRGAGTYVPLVLGGSVIGFAAGATGVSAGNIFASGGLSWGGVPDPGAGKIAALRVLADGFECSTTLTGSRFTTYQNADGALYVGIDNAAGSDLALGPGSPANLYCSTPGGVMVSTHHASASIKLRTASGNGVRIYPSGGVNVGNISTADPGAGGFRVGTATVNAALDAAGTFHSYLATAGAEVPARFNNPSGLAGYITCTGLTTAYVTASDQRLKTDHGRHTDLDALRRTVIHDFTWTGDGTPGRGVFAQEAVTVAPFAVAVGADDLDADGRLTKPWGVDYAKYVPDLIVGWQQHDTQVAELLAAVTALQARVTVLEAAAAPAPGGLMTAITEWLRARLRSWRPWRPVPA